jgi:hypothetical protein
MTAAEWFIVGAILVGAAEHIIAISPFKENSTVQLVITILKRIFPKRS